MLNKITYYLLNLTSSCWQLKTYTATLSVSLLHSTETAMHWLLWDALASGGSWQTASDADRIAEIILPSAFDRVDHELLLILQRLHHQFGLFDTVL